ncbi:MAG: hypothetical protein QF654_08260 [Alphaproteobacteria bacterium]|jgi:hypothetical protein|nr:hypothetical protein [Alphaproteobacteria bacterium]|tara:strand:- start:367 stop:531 length:165 start_codon:yes stop_codon:yes gene_type:complete
MTTHYEARRPAGAIPYVTLTEGEIHSATVRARKERAEVFAKLLKGGIGALRKLI